MPNIWIHHHLGLGDSFICNGLVRELSKQYKHVHLYAKYCNYDNISFMYRDLNKLTVLGVKDDNIPTQGSLLRIGFGYIPYFQTLLEASWDQAFYLQCEIDFKKRWDSFYVQRDFQRELALFNKLNPLNLPFILINKSGSDGIDRINYNYINPKILQINIEKGQTNNIFDYLTLMERAEEIHCIDSAPKHLFDSFNLGKKPLFYHNIDKQRMVNQHQSRNIWKTV
jgi:hypothetical protein